MKTLYFNFLLIISLFLFTACPPEMISGCMDSLACNYNLEATEDNGSCVLPDGCIDDSACNYDSSASCDDGSCLYESDALPNPIEITFIEDNVSGAIGEDIVSHIYIRNASCEVMNNLVVRKWFNNPDASAYFCFNGICFPSTTTLSPNPLNLDPFQEDDYFKGYLNSSVPGIFEVTYRFYIEDTPSDFTETVITYEVN